MKPSGRHSIKLLNTVHHPRDSREQHFKYKNGKQKRNPQFLVNLRVKHEQIHKCVSMQFEEWGPRSCRQN